MMIKKFLKIKAKSFTFLFFLFLIFPFQIKSAILSLEPSSGEYYQGDVFMVEIKIDTQGEKVNAIKGELIFPTDKLKIVDVSEANSVLSLWPESPIFQNDKGIVSFVGGRPLGFEGKDNVLSLFFQVIYNDAEETTEAKIEFSENCLVLLNDGLGSLASLEKKEANFKFLAQKREESEDVWQKMLKEDKIPPEDFVFEIKQDPLIFDGKYFLIFLANDKQTGIDHYEVSEQKALFGAFALEKAKWEIAKSPYLLKDQTLKSIIKIKAVDKAGNMKILEYVPGQEFLFYVAIGLLIILISLILCFLFVIKQLRMRKK